MLAAASADSPVASVLVVDDIPAVLLAARAMLECHGYQVFIAESGAAEISELDALHGQVDLIMLDYRLPDMKAAEVVVALRSRYPAVKILLVSASAHDQMDASLADLPFLPKPLRFSDIAGAVASFFEPRPAKPRARSSAVPEPAG